ncbi:MAG: uracil-DNA glycosylase [Gammaproteobacteria bacterium]|nr:MAG: uracil-DNA glycosylase [Gammaproteobacteria bacterium]
MGIQPWERRVKSGSDKPSEDIGALDWDALEERIRQCTRCDLAQSRTQAVPGVGNRQAEWMIVGEAPGAEEDKKGEPFVGRAGKLLDKMLKAIGLAREAVYITNIVKCRPPNNRDPLPGEIAACKPYLERQIALLQPRIILAVGRIAAQSLLETKSNLGALRGKRFHYDQTSIPVVVTYHPAYLLRAPIEKRKAWEDLVFARRLFEENA